jgi:hypothetical protein
MKKKLVERRKHKRFQAPIGVFAGIGPGFTKVGRITDMSLDGLAFRYLGKEEPSNGSYLDIFCTDYNFYLAKIPFKTISDFEKVKHGPSSAITMRQSGLQFRELTHYQKCLLAHFIQNHSIGEA